MSIYLSGSYLFKALLHKDALIKLQLNIFLCLIGEQLILIQYSVLEGKEDKQQPDQRQPVVLNGFSLISTQLQILQNHQKPQLLQLPPELYQQLQKYKGYIY